MKTTASLSSVSRANAHNASGANYHAQTQNGVIQRVQAQRNNTFNSGAAKAAVAGGGGALPAMGAIAYGGATAANTGTSATRNGIHNPAYGSGVGGFRPNNWARLMTLSNNNNPWRQLHLMNDNLGGLGQNTNLGPGSASFNAQHLHAAETPVKNFAGHSGAAVAAQQAADYSVTATYGNPVQVADYIKNNLYSVDHIENEVVADFNAKIDNHLEEELENWKDDGNDPEEFDEDGIRDTYLETIREEHDENAQTWIDNYVAATFPSSFTCTATFYEINAGVLEATAAQNATVSYV